MSPSLELATFTPHSALLALASGVQRIEFCSLKSLDGLTPSIEDYLFITSHLSSASSLSSTHPTTHPSIPQTLNIMIRPPPPSNLHLPPSSDFLIPPSTFTQMKAQIQEFKNLGVRGFVFGILKHDAEGKMIIDQERCSELIKIAREGEDREKVRCTFHRAFDWIDGERMGEELEVLINLTFTSLLTSGGPSTSTSTSPSPSPSPQQTLHLRNLIHQANGRIEIIVGGGIRSHNLKTLIEETGAPWYHSSAVTGEGEEVDVEEVRRLREIVDRYRLGEVGEDVVT